MGLNGSLAIASSGLAAIQSEMAVASQNVANASTAGYAQESSSVVSRTAAGIGSGVVIGLTTRTVNVALQSSLYTQNATVAALTAVSNGLTTVSALEGSTSATSGSSDTLADNLGNLQTSLTTLETDPSNAAGQQSVVSAATTLASSVRDTANSYQVARQAAQESIVSDVQTANDALARIGSISDRITQLQATGISTADLENQRASAMNDLSSVLSVQYTETSNGDMLVSTANGLNLPTHQTSGPLATADATLNTTSAYPGSIPPITLNGRDVTTSLAGGTLGGQLQLRDQVLPTMQAQLDSFSQSLASRFDAQGLTLFVTSSGTVPGNDPTLPSPAGQNGFSNDIQVNPAIVANASIVRDGSHAVTGSSAGASAFTVNTGRGPGDTTLIDRLLDYGLGADAQAGVTQPAAQTSGLGVGGTLSAAFSGTTDLLSLASSVTSAQASVIGQASTSLTNETATQTTLAAKVASVSGVSVDDEMASIVTLQNAYAANAKVVTAVQSMFSSLLSAIS